MKKNKLFLLVALFAAFALVLAACGGNGDTDTPPVTGDNNVVDTNNNGGDNDTSTPEPDETTPPEETVDTFAALQAMIDYHGLGMATTNDAPHIEGGTLRFGVGLTGTPEWTFLEPVFSSWSSEGDIRAFTHEPLLMMGQDFFPNNDVNSLATASFDRDAQTVTIYLNHETTWADGHPLTLADLVYAYYFLANAEFRWPNADGDAVPQGRHFAVNPRDQNVVGVCTFMHYSFYHAGFLDELRDMAACGGPGVLPDEMTDTITGLTLSEDEMTLTIEFYEVTPYTFAFDFWVAPMPAHHWEGIPVGQRRNHPRAMHEVLGNGAFTIAGSVANESFHFVRNDNFWRGPAILDGIIYEAFPAMTAPDLARVGTYDVLNHPQSLFTPENRNLNNATFLTNPFNSGSTSWLTFRVGDWDAELGQVVPWEGDDVRVSPTLRTAIALATDRVTPGRELFNSLVVPSGSVYWPLNRMDLITGNVETFNTFELDRARQMLDEAGYTFCDNSGFRCRPDGSELYVTWLETTGSAANDTNNMFWLDGWRYDLGVDVRLYQGNLVDSAVWSEVTQQHISNEVDMFWSGISFGANPAPNFGFAHDSVFNRTRWTSPEWQEIIERFNSDAMWDEAVRIQTINDWEQAFMDARVAFPLTIALPLTAVNNRVANLSLENTFGDNDRPGVTSPGQWNAHLWALTADTPYSH